MDPTRADKLGRRLESRVPLLGGWLRRRALRLLIESGSPAAARALAEALIRCSDPLSQASLREGLRRMASAECRDAVCSVWARTRAGVLLEVLAEARHVPAGPAVLRVLVALKLGCGELVARGGSEAVGLLLGACADADPDVSGRARLLLGNLPDPAAREALCRRVIEGDDPVARGAALAAGYLPHDPDRRALFYFLTDQWGAYEQLDFERTLLRAAYQAAPDGLRRRILGKAREAGRAELVEALAGGGPGRMSGDEWGATLDVLGRNGAWDQLWRLARKAPAHWSARIVRRLSEAGWGPGGPERAEYEELCGPALGWEASVLGAAEFCRATLMGHPGTVECLAVSPDGGLLASGGGKDPVVRLWHLPGGEALPPLAGHTGPITCVAFSRDGSLLASGSDDESVIVWKLPEGRPLKKFYERLGPVTGLAFHPRGEMVAVLSPEFVQVWLLTHHELDPRAIPCRGATCLAVAPEKLQLATGSPDGLIHLWDPLDGELLRELIGPADGVVSLAYSPDGRVLASTTRDGTVRLWDVAAGRSREALAGHWLPEACPGFEGERLPFGRRRERLSMAWRLPDGRRLLARCRGRTIHLWAPPGAEPCEVLTGHTGVVTCLAAGPDGTLASGSTDGTIRLWGPTSRAARLAHTPVEQTSLADWEWVRGHLREPGAGAAERCCLQFLDALLGLRWRGAIHVEESAPRAAGGAYDISIEG